MTSEGRQRYVWFKASLAAGALLGVLLLVQSLVSYRYVSERLTEDQLRREAERHVSFLESYARQARILEPIELGGFLDEILSENPKKVAWIRVLDLRGRTQVLSGDPGGAAFTPEELRPLVRLEERELSAVRTAPFGKVLVTALPFRARIGERAPRPPGAPPPGGGPRFSLIEIALHMDGASGSFGRLRRNLIVSTSAALALVGSMILLGLRLQNYIRGKQLEQELAIARGVQQELLPEPDAVYREMDVAAECVPAWQVGGDFYDIFNAGERHIAFLLGDVSGKGTPAALLMALLHGALRSASWMEAKDDHEEATRRLNELLCSRTAKERFASLFWASYDRDEQVLHYVNAGHPPPLLVRGDGAAASDIQRLEDGGPVLGLLPLARYKQGSVELRPGDLLVVFSDGVVEATNSADEEFGEERLTEALRAKRNRPAGEIRAEVLRRIREFLGKQPLHDDLTLLVARFGGPGVSGG